MDDLESRLQRRLDQRGKADQLRRRTVVRPIDATRVEIDGQILTNFSSNDYLGLSHHPRILAAWQSAAETIAGAGAAGLISGYQPAHASAEKAIAKWKGTQSAVLMPSGYQANFAAIQTLAASSEKPDGVRFLMDKLCHASLVDAIRASGCPWRVFPHNGLAKLQRLLADAAKNQLQIVVTESIFSMDGDAADLAGLAELKKRYPFSLVLDEAHGSGVYGCDGAGLASEMGRSEMVDVAIVTLSKAAGCVGAALCASDVFCQSLLNFGRAYIYTTSVPAAVAVACQAALEVMHDEPARQQRLRSLAQHVRQSLAKGNWRIQTGDSPIISLVVGEETEAINCAQLLRKSKCFVQAVRPPTVAPGTSRLRITLSSAHSDQQVDQLLDALEQINLKKSK